MSSLGKSYGSPTYIVARATLQFLLEALDTRVVAIERYTLERQDGSMRVNVDGEEVDWRWILRNPSWEWVKEGGAGTR